MGNKLLDVATTTGGGSDLVTFFLLLRREDERGNNGSCNAVLSFLTTIEEDDDGARVVTVAEVENEGAKVGHEVVLFNFLRRNRSPSFFRYLTSMVSFTKSASRSVYWLSECDPFHFCVGVPLRETDHFGVVIAFINGECGQFFFQ